MTCHNNGPMHGRSLVKRWDYPGIGSLAWTVPLRKGCPSTNKGVFEDSRVNNGGSSTKRAVFVDDGDKKASRPPNRAFWWMARAKWRAKPVRAVGAGLGGKACRGGTRRHATPGYGVPAKRWTLCAGQAGVTGAALAHGGKGTRVQKKRRAEVAGWPEPVPPSAS